MKDFVLEIDIITTLLTQETTRQNKCLMRFVEKLVLKQDVDNKLIINEITCSILESSSTYNDDDT